MSTIPYGPNGEYRIGIWKWVGSTNKKGEKTDVSTKSLLIPTYGFSRWFSHFD